MHMQDVISFPNQSFSMGPGELIDHARRSGLRLLNWVASWWDSNVKQSIWGVLHCRKAYIFTPAIETRDVSLLANRLPLESLRTQRLRCGVRELLAQDAATGPTLRGTWLLWSKHFCSSAVNKLSFAQLFMNLNQVQFHYWYMHFFVAAVLIWRCTCFARWRVKIPMQHISPSRSSHISFLMQNWRKRWFVLSRKDPVSCSQSCNLHLFSVVILENKFLTARYLDAVHKPIPCWIRVLCQGCLCALATVRSLWDLYGN